MPTEQIVEVAGSAIMIWRWYRGWSWFRRYRRRNARRSYLPGPLPGTY